MTDPGGGDLFIVDNSISGWTALEYLRQWTDVARSFDIATGFKRHHFRMSSQGGSGDTPRWS